MVVNHGRAIHPFYLTTATATPCAAASRLEF